MAKMIDIELQMTVREFKLFADYLDRHEHDIAESFDDFADLKGLFKAVFEQEPSIE